MAKPEILAIFDLAPYELEEERRKLQEAIGPEFQVKVGSASFLIDGVTPVVIIVLTTIGVKLLQSMTEDTWTGLKRWFGRRMRSKSDQEEAPASESRVRFHIQERDADGSEFEIDCEVLTDSPDVVMKAIQSLSSAQVQAKRLKAKAQPRPGQRLMKVSADFDEETGSWALPPGAAYWTEVVDETSD